MRARTILFVFLLVGLALGPVSCGHPEDGGQQNAEVEWVEPEMTRANDPSGVYSTLAEGGQMYAGTVLSVTVKESVPGRQGRGPFEELGSFRFRVDKVVIGPAMREFTLPYWWMTEEPDEVPLIGDWVGNDGPWRQPPRTGARLLLLLAKKAPPDQVRSWDPVAHVWCGVGADHALVRGFQDASQFLAAKDVQRQDRLFCNLCASPSPSHRAFALDAVYSHDPPREKQRWLQYLRFAVPLIKGGEERAHFVWGFAGWLRAQRDWPPGIPEAGVAAFAEFCWQELEVRDPWNGLINPVHCRAALEGLEVLLRKRGVVGTLALLNKHGRAALEERIRACAKAKDADVQKASKRVSTLLRLGFEPGWPQGIPETALSAFAEFCWEELGARHQDRTLARFRCLEALHGLEVLLRQRGVAATLALFQEHGRAALEERLRSVAQAVEAEIQRGAPPCPDIQKARKRVLALLSGR